MNVIQARPSSFITRSMNKISRRSFRIVSGRAGTLTAHSRAITIFSLVPNNAGLSGEIHTIRSCYVSLVQNSH